MGKEKSIIETASLQNYFYQNLSDLNKRSLCPVPEEMIYYSSTVMENFSVTGKLFEIDEGKVKEKVLGLKILEASHKNSLEKKRILKDVGDTALLVCGYFSSSINKKILDSNYYVQLGRMAYGQLNNLAPELLNVPSFYHMMATSFENLTTLIALIAKSNEADPFKHLLIEEYSDLELKCMGSIPNRTKKIS